MQPPQVAVFSWVSFTTNLMAKYDRHSWLEICCRFRQTTISTRIALLFFRQRSPCGVTVFPVYLVAHLYLEQG